MPSTPTITKAWTRQRGTRSSRTSTPTGTESAPPRARAPTTGCSSARPHPDYYGGLRNTIRWGGFDLTAFFQYSFGADIFNAMRWYADDGGYFFDNKFRDVLDDYWTPDNPNASQPRPSYYGTSGARYDSSRLLEDADYIRLGEVTLGYTLPDRFAAGDRRPAGAPLRGREEPLHLDGLLRLRPRSEQLRIERSGAGIAWARISTPTH